MNARSVWPSPCILDLVCGPVREHCCRCHTNSNAANNALYLCPGTSITTSMGLLHKYNTGPLIVAWQLNNGGGERRDILEGYLNNGTWTQWLNSREGQFAKTWCASTFARLVCLRLLAIYLVCQFLDFYQHVRSQMELGFKQRRTTIFRTSHDKLPESLLK